MLENFKGCRFEFDFALPSTNGMIQFQPSVYKMNSTKKSLLEGIWIKLHTPEALSREVGYK